MKIIFDIGHPGQVHLFRKTIETLSERGNDIIVTVKEIPVAMKLLEAYGIPFISLGKKFDSIFLKGFSQLRYNYNLWKIARKQGTELGVGSSITLTHVSVFRKMKAVILDDDDAEAVRLFSLFAHPFADCIISPAALSHQKNKRKGIVYNGTHELFYLHPDQFKPDPAILEEAGLEQGEKFFIVRFVSGKAYHDRGHKWMSLSQKTEIVDLLKSYGRVIVTTEGTTEPEFSELRMKIPPEKIHHLMFFATIFVGDSQTMTSEAAILGTPAIKCNTFAHRLSIPNMLEEKYSLCYSFQPDEFEKMKEKISELLGIQDLKKIWMTRRKQFLADSINPASFLVWFIENWPESFRKIKEDPEYPERFGRKQPV